MTAQVLVVCPADGDQRVPADAVIVDLESRIVAFSCPVCQDLIRHRCREETGALLGHVLRTGAVQADLAPRRRLDVCDGAAWTPTEAFNLHCELGTLVGLR